MAGHDVRTVLDVGANVGRFVRKIRRVLPEATIYAFEPLAACHATIVGEFAGDPRVRALNIALGDENGQTVIHHSAHSPASSLLPMSERHRRTYPHTAASSDETIRVRPLDAVAGELDIRPEVLVKMDVQGYEDRVIRGGRETLSRSRVLLMETSFVELYEGQLLFDGLYDLLRPMGYAFRGFTRQAKDPASGAVLFGDAIFIRA